MPFTHTNAMHVLFIHKNKHDDSKNKRYRITHMPPFVITPEFLRTFGFRP